MFKFIALAALVGILVILALAARRPDTFLITRSAHIDAPPQRVFEQINDFQRWRAWSPFEALDPAMQRDIGGAPQGVGATYRWDGNRKAGAGRMEIMRSVPASKVEIALHFTRPMDSRSTAEFTVVPSGHGSEVTWSMHGNQPFIGKVFGLFVNMDRMIGRDFETGLGNLKRISEQPASATQTSS